WRVPAHVAHFHARQHLGAPVDELHQPVPVHQWREVVGNVSAPAAQIGMQREVPLAVLDEMPSLWKRELERSALTTPGKPAGVIPVQVRRDYRIHLIGPYAQ